jgi:hypothetical protein
MNCCDEYGNCHQGRDCPIRKGQQANPKAKYPVVLVVTLLLGSAAVSLSIIYGLWWLAGVL